MRAKVHGGVLKWSKRSHSKCDRSLKDAWVRIPPPPPIKKFVAVKVRYMKRCFIIHGSFGDSHEHWIPWLKTELEKLNFEVIAPNFPIGKDVQCYDSWKKVLDKFKSKIDENTIFIGRSLAPIFIVKYILENNLKIGTLFSVSGFNGKIGNSDYDYVNKTFFIKDVAGFEKVCKKRVCFISKNDPYVPYFMLCEFQKSINAEQILIKNAGHFNTDSGYTKFQELLDLIKKSS